MAFYIFAHRVNAAGPLQTALDYGANALEIDVSRRGSGYWAWHGTDVVDYVYTRLEDHLEHIADRLTRPAGQHVSLLVLDLKYKNLRNRAFTADRINEVRQMVRDIVLARVNGPTPRPDQRGLIVLYGMTRDQETVMADAISSQGALPLNQHEGINYDGVVYKASQRASPVQADAWRATNEVQRFMYSAGISARLRRKHSRDHLEQVQTLRADRGGNLDFLTYSWTFNRAGKATRWANAYDLDGVMGNMGNNFGYLPQHLDYYGLAGRRLTTRDDPPGFLD